MSYFYLDPWHDNDADHNQDGDETSKFIIKALIVKSSKCYVI